MHFSSSVATCLMATSLCANALPQPTVAGDNDTIHVAATAYFSGTKDVDGYITEALAPSEQSDAAIQKRGAYVAVIGIAAVKGVAILTKMAIEIGADTIKDLGQWDAAREAFTKKTTAEMWGRNPDRNKYPAAICYNKAYHVRDPKGTEGKVSAKLELGQLFTNYDCLYMTGNNAFYTDSDNGFVNLSYSYDANRCSHDAKTGDLTCR